MQGGPGPTGLKGNRGESGPAVRTVFTPDLHLLNHIMSCLNLCLTPYMFWFLSCSKGTAGVARSTGTQRKAGKNSMSWVLSRLWHWKKSEVFCAVLQRAAIWLECGIQGRSGMDGGRGIPGDSGLKVKYVFIVFGNGAAPKCSASTGTVIGKHLVPGITGC